MTASSPLRPFDAAYDEDTDSCLRLLVVDDEPDVCEILSTALQASRTCKVHVAYDAMSALRLLSNEDEPFDGIFLDIQMPGTTGIELCSIIRSTPGYNDVPILMLTAMTERRFLHGAYSRGADDYITKPFEFDEIRARLMKEQWLRKRRTHMSASRATLGYSGSNGPVEVINALEDAVHLSAVPRCVRRYAFQNYVLQTRAKPGNAIAVRAIKLAATHDIFTKLSTVEYQNVMHAIAHAVSDLTMQTEDVITHLGNGILLTACDGQSALNSDALKAQLKASGLEATLKSYDLPLRVIVGDEQKITDGSNADVVFLFSAAIDSVEAREEDLCRWANFREWLSFRKSTGRERARMDQSAYEQILNDFLSDGGMAWKRSS